MRRGVSRTPQAAGAAWGKVSRRMDAKDPNRWPTVCEQPATSLRAPKEELSRPPVSHSVSHSARHPASSSPSMSSSRALPLLGVETQLKAITAILAVFHQPNRRTRRSFPDRTRNSINARSVLVSPTDCPKGRPTRENSPQHLCFS